MKKVSTAAANEIRNFSEQKLTIGLDLGDRSSWYCVLDATGEVVLEQRLSTTAKAMKEVFRTMPRSRIALETQDKCIDDVSVPVHLSPAKCLVRRCGEKGGLH